VPVLDLSIKIDYRNEPRPDVVVIKRAHANVSPVPVGDAILAVEVISPDSHFRDMYAKAKVYAAVGLPTTGSSIRSISTATFLPSSASATTAVTR
jgi:Uma2 family endonuclease